jgi:hypothetical protein
MDVVYGHAASVDEQDDVLREVWVKPWREPSRGEIRSALRPYFRRQWLVDKLYLLGLTSY